MEIREMKKLIIKITDTMYEKIVNYEVDAPTQMIESIRHGIVLPKINELKADQEGKNE